jgi:transposase InsO family protein
LLLANCNAHIERFIGSFKREVAERMIFFGEANLRQSIDEYLLYYNRERNHQGLGSRIMTLSDWPEESRQAQPDPL